MRSESSTLTGTSHFDTMRLASLTFVNALFFAISEVQAGWSNFYATCDSATMTSNNIMRANCRKSDGGHRLTNLNLNKCIVNTNGNLGCQPE